MYMEILEADTIKQTEMKEKKLKGASQENEKISPNQNHYHPHVVLSAWISQTYSCQPSLSFIAPGKSSRLHPLSEQKYSRYVLAGRPTLVRPCKGVRRSMSLMISSLFLQQCPSCLVLLILMFFVMDGRWPYSSSFQGCCLHDLFNTARSILVQLPSSFFSVRVVHPYSCIDVTAARKKKMCIILSIRSDFHMTDRLSIAVQAFASRVLMPFSVDETLFPRQVKFSTNFRSCIGTKLLYIGSSWSSM